MKTTTEVRVGDVWQSNGPKKAKVRVCEITSAGLVRWSGITIRDNGIARDFTRNRVLIERDGNPVTTNHTPEPS